MPTATPAKFTARNLPALEKLARECGLEHTFRNWSKCYTFAPGELVDGDYPALGEDDESKLVRFCERATEMFGDREHFFASNRWRFVRVTWERDTRADAQRNNMD